MLGYFLITLYLQLLCLYAYARIPPGHNEILLKDIFDGYDKRVRPFSNEKKLVVISETVLGCMLIQVEENKQIVSYIITRKQKWTDPRFKWNPSKYDGIQSVLVPIRDVWRSDIFNYNNKDFENLLPVAKDWAKIEFDGNVSIIMPQYVETTCKIMVHRFPFDTQFCSLSSSSNMMDSTQFTFESIPVNYKPKLFQGNSEWSVENVSIISRNEPDDGVWGEKGYVFQYVLQLKRSPTYYLTVIVIPTFLITAVSIVGVFAPGTEHEPGDVANLGLGALLALMLLLGIVSEKLPKSQEMPLLGFHILVILLVLVLCILLEMTSIYYFQKMSLSGKSPPQWLYKFSSLYGFWPWGERMSSNDSRSSSSTLTNSKSVSTISSSLSNGSENDIRSRDSFENGRQTPRNSLQKNLIKRVFSNNEKKDGRDFKKWENVIGELKTKHSDIQLEIKKEWDDIASRMDFVWIGIFEGFNILNLLSLVWFANLPILDMKYWLE